MPRHVVLLTRDTSLAVALKALLGGHDQVTELESPKAWRTLNGSSVDAVVIDLPPALRKAAVEALELRFTGKLVVLLDPGENPAQTVDRQRCAVLQRPFGMSELWTLLVAPGPEATPDSPAAPPRPAERSDANVFQPTEPRSGGSSEHAPAPANRQAPGRPPEPAWRWRLRRFQQAPTPSQPSELTRPLPSVELDSNGNALGPTEVEANPRSAGGPDAAGVLDRTGGPETEAGPDAAVVPEAEAAPDVVEVRDARGTPDAREVPDAEEVPNAGEGPDIAEGSSTAAAPASAGVPDKAGVPARGDLRTASLMDTTMWNEANEAPQAVASRLAKRLRLDVAALLLDNGQGLLETAGGVGLKPAERRLQVEYGHDVLRELFRVGVGLIDDTERVRSILGGIPFGAADTLMMVPLVHEGHGFGILLAGRHRSGRRDSEFTEFEIEALMDFAEDVAPALRSAILLRRLKGQLNHAEER